MSAAKKDPHPCPKLFEMSGIGSKESWYTGGTVCCWSDGFRYYRGLVRGDGYVFVADDRGPGNPNDPRKAYFVPRPVQKTRPILENLFNMLMGHPMTEYVSGQNRNGNSTGMFLRGETSVYKYEDE